MIESVDESVGRVMQTLEELEIADRTVIIFTSDNGGLSAEEGPDTPATSNAPLREGKGYLYEGGIRVPLIVYWPGVVSPGSTSDVPVASVDLYPTLVEMVGLRVDPGNLIDGVSLVPLLKQAGSPEREALFWHYPHYGHTGGEPGGAIRQGDYKLIEFYEDRRLELYNLSKDIGEESDLSRAMPRKTAELRTLLDTWRKSLGAQIPKPNPRDP